MRLASVGIVASLALSASCAKPETKPATDRDDKAHAGSGSAAVAVTKPLPPVVPSTPLPPLAADPGGATGKTAWVTGFGGLDVDAPRDLAVEATGESYVVGYFQGETDLGALGKRTSAGASDAFVVKLDAAGKLAWAQTFGDKREDVATGVAVHGNTVVVVGNFLDHLKLGEFPAHDSMGSDDLFVAAFNRAGEALWIWTAGGIDSDGANCVAATPDGGWVVGGSFTGTAKFGTAQLKSKGRTDAILIKLAADGDIQWVKQFGGAFEDAIQHVAVDPQGSIYIQGSFKDIADFGGKPLKAGGGSDDDVVLAKYDANGNHLWSQRFGNDFNDVAGGLTVDPSGHVTMTGSFDRSASFGAGDDHTSQGESDIFVARFTTDGVLEWAKTFGSPREDIGFGIASDKAGNTVTTGWFQNTVDFGTGPLTSKGNKDVFALKLDARGNTVWARRFGDHDHDQARAVAIDDKGSAYIAGLFRFALDAIDPPLQSNRADGDRLPKPDVFVLKLDR